MDLPEHLPSRKKVYVGGERQRQAVPQPVDLWEWGACGHTLHADGRVHNGAQLLRCVAVAFYYRRH